MLENDDLVQMIEARFVTSVELQTFLAERVWPMFRERKRALFQAHAVTGKASHLKDFRLSNWAPMTRTQHSRLTVGDSYYSRKGPRLWQLVVVTKFANKLYRQPHGDPVEGPPEHDDETYFEGRGA